ncbi:MAG: TolC family protein [Stenotrophobium sp.]
MTLRMALHGIVAVLSRLRLNACAWKILPLALGLSGCASYTAMPLDGSDVEQALQSPDRGALTRAAADLHHPRLAPVMLDFSKPLTPDELAVIAVLANPDLKALRARQNVVQAQVFAAGLLPDPQLSLGLDHPITKGFTNAFAAGLSLDIGALFVRGKNVDAAQSAAQQVRLDIAWQEWLAAGQARLLAVRIASLEQAAQLTQDGRDIADRALSRALTAAGRGDLKADEVELRRIAAADADTRALTVARDLAAARQDLNRLLGLPPDAALNLAVVAPPVETTPDAAALFERAKHQRLDLQAFAAGYQSQEIAVRRAVLGQYPRLALTLNRNRDTSGVQTFGPAISLDLPLWNHNRGAIRVAEADRSQLRAEYEARLFNTRADIAALVDSISREQTQLEQLSAQIPALQQIAGHFAAAAQRGDVTASAAEAAQASLLDKQLALNGLQQAIDEQRIALELNVGAPLTESGQ